MKDKTVDFTSLKVKIRKNQKKNKYQKLNKLSILIFVKICEELEKKRSQNLVSQIDIYYFHKIVYLAGCSKIKIADVINFFFEKKMYLQLMDTH